MSADTILIDSRPGELRIAWLAGDRLVDLAVHAGAPESTTGDIRLGRVTRVVGGIQAAFVDIGEERAGFLALAEARPRPGGGDDRIGDYVSEGDAVPVQLLRDAMEDKGAKLTARPVIHGRYLVFLPGQGEIRLSRKIEKKAERARLHALATEAAGAEDGFIVRTAAVGIADEAIRREGAELRARWQTIKEAATHAEAPARLGGPGDDPLGELLCTLDADRVRRIVVADPSLRESLRRSCAQAMPDIAELLCAPETAEPLFEAFNVEEQIEAALAASVPLPGGGSLIIEETAALVAVDVNSGPRAEGSDPAETAYRTNLEAAETIARQIGLRELSGRIVIDFVGTRRRDHRAAVLDRLRAALALDPQGCDVAGYTVLGLVELTRPRTRRSLRDRLTIPCPDCPSGRVRRPEQIAAAALRTVQREARAAPGAPLVLRARPVVIDMLNGVLADARRDVEAGLGAPLVLAADAALAPETFDIHPQPRKAE